MNVTTREELIPLTPQVLQILVALAHRPFHGYGLAQDCRVQSDGRINIRPTTLYAALNRLEHMGLIAAGSQEPGQGSPNLRKYYHLTDNGRTVLTWELERLKHVVEQGYAVGLLH